MLPSTPHRRSNSAASNSSVSRDFQPVENGSLPLLNEVLGPSILAELSDGTATLDMNMQHLSKVHNSLHSFNENFAGFLHSMKMNAWCVDFPEAPTSESFTRDRSQLDPKEPPHSVTLNEKLYTERHLQAPEYDATYLTNDDGSFLSEPIPKWKPSGLPRVASLVGSGTTSTRSKSASSSRATSSSGRPLSSSSKIPAPSRHGTSRIPTAKGSRLGSSESRGTTGTSSRNPNLANVAPRTNTWR